MKPPVNLTLLQKDYAVFLPAISCFYSTYVSKQRKEEFVPKERIPPGFDRGIEGMNFLNPEQGYFTYKYGLYSAGHAQLDLNKTMIQDSMVQDRDRQNTLILGDSGGYQIGKGVLQFDWKDFEGQKANKVKSDILNWLELTADWSMMLDVPTWACDHNNQERTGLKSFEDCLEKTRINNKFFLDNRLGQTKFLNVLQGQNWDTAEKWYQGVKEFSDPLGEYKGKEAEGWAMGGVNMSRMHITLRRLMALKFDGLLNNKDWMHFLGTAQLDWSCYLTSIQRQIRETINESFTVSFDCASPFIATAHGLVYTNARHNSKQWSTVMEKAPDNKMLAGWHDIPFPFESEIGRRLSISDVCHYAPGKLNKVGKEGKTSWDSFGYALMMAHNVYCHIVAVQRANNLMDIECARFKPDWRRWTKLKGSDKSDELSEWVPRNIIYFDRYVEELFACKTKSEAYEMIEEAERIGFLQNLHGARMRGGVRSIADSLFVEVGNEDISPWTNDREDDNLDKLESLIKEGIQDV
jgi:hypothetical protein